MEKPSIIIVDDHLIFRQGLKSLLTSGNIASVIGEASNGQEFIDLLASLKPDLVLMDIDMPGMNGLEATQLALKILPDLKIIAFTMFGDEYYYYKMVEFGVQGFVLKSSGISELEKAIMVVMSGETYFSNEVLRRIISTFGRTNAQNPTGNIGLTERELVVLQHICFGLSNEEIGQKLFISAKTVKSHRSNLLEKTGCKNTPALIFYAIKSKIVVL